MNRKNYDVLEEYVSELKSKLTMAAQIEMQTEESRDMFEALLIYQAREYKMLFEILKSERVCSHCSVLDNDGKK